MDIYSIHSFKLIKSGGKVFENVKGNIQKNIVAIKDHEIPVEAGDIIEQIFPSGVVVRNEIIDVRYFGSKKHGFPAYECDLKTQSNIAPKAQNTVFNISDAEKININSIDNSVNNITITPDEVFDKLSDVIVTQLNNNQELLKLLAEMKIEKGKPNFALKYKNFIELASPHMSIIAPFISALTQMI
jgi:hypothetical protein